MNASDDADAAGTWTVRVWDPMVRLFHWTVAGGCLLNLIRDDGDAAHRAIGYAVAAAVAVRLVWGFAGRGHARFASFVPRPAQLRRYLGQRLQRRAPRYLGHNPAGAVMMLALIGLLVGVSLSGWLIGLDRYWGNTLLEEVHARCADAILALAAIHVLAALFESRRHDENLVRAMITGDKRRPAATDIDNATDPG